ncbi:hypothetical protein [Streptomyces sp. NBC_01435]|uniref:hypothetical protein n=1 Tax=Streptomyces sp. NBC_01435 TaxID=2903865 RepID=UPI002E36E5D2|nr:hypothetical protein [Streptomyces sp. NBC_01435]
MTIASGIVPGDGETDPDAIGARYYTMYEQRDRAEEIIGDPGAFQALVDEQVRAVPPTHVREG